MLPKESLDFYNENNAIVKIMLNDGCYETTNNIMR